MGMRDWEWQSVALGGCSVEECRNDLANGLWKDREGREGARCWDHYKEALARGVVKDPPEVRAERERIAAAIEAWYFMWSKPVRVAFTAKTVKPSEMMNKRWLLDFAREIRAGTFGVPHGGGEPDAVYET